MKILVALDGSKASNKALRKAISIAKKYETGLTLIHVAQTDIKSWVIPPHLRKDFGIKGLEAGRNLLEKAERVVKKHNILVETLLVEGHPVEEIVRAAERLNFHMIVLGERGRSSTRMLLVGSVAEKVLRWAKCSVLIVK